MYSENSYLNATAHPGYAQANHTSGYAAQAVEAPPALISDVARRLEMLNTLIADTSGDLVMLTDRLFGTAPRAASTGSGANKPSGVVAELLSSMDALIERAAYMREEARNLNGRI